MNIKKTAAGYVVTEHAKDRMCRRRINPNMVELVLDYGRTVHTKNAEFHAVGRKEVEQYRRLGIDLRKIEGVHVVIEDDALVTVFRNRNFKELRN